MRLPRYPPPYMTVFYNPPSYVLLTPTPLTVLPRSPLPLLPPPPAYPPLSKPSLKQPCAASYPQHCPLTLSLSLRHSRSTSSSSLEIGTEACIEEAGPRPAHPEMRVVSAAERWRGAAIKAATASAKASERLGLRGPGERLCLALRLSRHS